MTGDKEKLRNDDIQTVALGRLKDYLESAAELLDGKGPDWYYVQRNLWVFLEVQAIVFSRSSEEIERDGIEDLVNLALAEAGCGRKRDVTFIKERVNLARQKLEKFTSQRSEAER